MVCFRLKNNGVYTTAIWMLMIVTTCTKVINKEDVDSVQENELNTDSAAFQLWINQTGDDDQTSVDNIIKEKVNELKPFLEDYAVEGLAENDTITLEGDDETTIIEFNSKIKPPNKSDEETKAVENKAKEFQENLQKYKKLRSKIKRALKRDNASNKTRALVTMTLDKMITKMIEHRCSLSDRVRYRGMITNETNKIDFTNLIQSWNKQWSKLKHKFKKNKGSGKAEDAEISKDEFLKKFQDLISIMTYDLNTLAGKYKVVCRYEDIKKAESEKEYAHIIRSDKNKIKHRPQNIEDKKVVKIAAEKAVLNNNFMDTLPCSNFKICSEELTQFLLDFYINFNDTAVNVITNYAAMFLRDVNDDAYHEKERVAKLVENIAKTAEKLADSIFKKQTKKLNLSREHNRYTNLDILKKYVAKTIASFKKTIHKQVETSLESVREKLVFIIQKDIDVNMALELDNLERDVNARVCHNFEICNGMIFGRRKTSYVGDQNKVYVKVQVKLADEEKTEKVKTKTPIKPFKNIVTKYAIAFDITRTTPIINQLVLKIEPSAVQKDDLVFNAKLIPKNITRKDLSTNVDIKGTVPSIDQFILSMNPSLSVNESRKKIKDDNTNDIKVKISFLEEDKKEEKPTLKGKIKRSKLRNLRRAERMRQLALNKNKKQTVTVNDITEDIKMNYV